MKVPICAICTGGDKSRIVMVQEGKGVRHWPYEGHLSHPAVPPSVSHPQVSHPCETCGREKEYKGRECYACRKRRKRETALPGRAGD